MGLLLAVWLCYLELTSIGSFALGVVVAWLVCLVSFLGWVLLDVMWWFSDLLDFDLYDCCSMRSWAALLFDLLVSGLVGWFVEFCMSVAASCSG